MLPRVPDEGRVKCEQPVSWVIPGGGIVVTLGEFQEDDAFAVVVSDLRHRGEISLATAEPLELPSVRIQLMLTGDQRAGRAAGTHVSLSIDARLAHVMPSRRGERER